MIHDNDTTDATFEDRCHYQPPPWPYDDPRSLVWDIIDRLATSLTDPSLRALAKVVAAIVKSADSEFSERRDLALFQRYLAEELIRNE